MDTVVLLVQNSNSIQRIKSIYAILQVYFLTSLTDLIIMAAPTKMMYCTTCNTHSSPEMIECTSCLESVCKDNQCSVECDLCKKMTCMDDSGECYYCERPICLNCEKDTVKGESWSRPECCPDKLICPDCMHYHRTYSCGSCGKEDLCEDSNVFTCYCGQIVCIECYDQYTNWSDCIFCQEY